MKTGPKAKPVADRFFSKCKLIKKTKCWQWTGTIFPSGYGFFKVNGKMIKASRWAFQNFIGDPGRLFVCHKCDNKACVNPDHLFLGSHKDNMSDMKIKKRAARGSKNGFSKLTEDQVKYIVENEKVSIQVLAKMFKVDRSTVQLIRQGKNWSWLTGLNKVNADKAIDESWERSVY